MLNEWINKTFVVTGAAQGQGAAEAIKLLNLGARVIALDLHSPESVIWDNIKDHIEQKDLNNLIVFELDISQPTQWENLVEYINIHKVKINGLINNAGITLRKTVTKTSPVEWNNLMSINLNGAFYGIHFLAPLMEDNSSIVNISSTAGLTGYFSAAYTTSKWGLRGLTKAAAIELANRNIRVNTVCPGLVETPMMMEANTEHNAEKAKAFHEGNRQATPLARGASPEEIAEVALFLLSDKSSYINAADIPVDGGMIGGGIYWRIGKMTGDV